MSTTSGLGLDNGAYVRAFGAAAEGSYPVAVTPTAPTAVPGWQHTTLRVATPGAGETVEHASGEEETLVVPLVGSWRVEVTEADGTTHTVELPGRDSVFAGPTDVVYAGRGSTLRITSTSDADGARVALCGAPATKSAAPKPYRHLAADEVPVELRGAGIASREVRNMGLPDVLDADSFLVCEVITPAGNWSSWPPHKHDEERPGEETALEEIYYVETRSTDPRGTDPVGYLRVYGSSSERPVDVLSEVRTGDVVLVPHGWHGPAVAAPDADMYYLNVMAGPGAERAWLICDDPSHAWVREEWPHLPIDPRITEGR